MPRRLGDFRGDITRPALRAHNDENGGIGDFVVVF